MNVRRTGGFTLIELVVTIAFMGIVIVSLVELFTGLRQTNRAANNLTVATAVAQQIVERYRNTPYNNIALGTQDLSSQLSPYPNLLAPRSATATITAEATALKRVAVAVRYTDRTGVKNVQLVTLVGAEGVNR